MKDKEKAEEIALEIEKKSFLNGFGEKGIIINELKDAAMKMAEWKEQQMIEKTVKWIKSQMIPYRASPLEIFNYIENFKKYMEE